MKKRKNKQKGTNKEPKYYNDCIICDFLYRKEQQGLEPDFEGLTDAFRRQNGRSRF